MNNIGQRIRDLRKKNDLTQEKLADLLGVTYQSVSKWETGVTMPDLTQIAPLTRLLHVTSDELLGLTSASTDTRRAELEEACRRAWVDNGGERDGFRAIYDAEETLVREFPEDMKYLCDFARTVSNRAWNFEDKAVFRAEQERAVRYFETVLEHTDNEKVKSHAVDGITYVLTLLGRQEEAKNYVNLLPDAPVLTKEQAMEQILCGEEQRKFRQILLDGQLRVLLSRMTLCSAEELPALEHAENLLCSFFPDGNLLDFHEAMYNIQFKKAVRLIAENRYDEAVCALTRYKKHAILADEAEQQKEPVRYTSPYFDLLETEPCIDTEWGTMTHAQAFAVNLTDTLFDPLRDRADFQALLTE